MGTVVRGPRQRRLAFLTALIVLLGSPTRSSGATCHNPSFKLVAHVDYPLTVTVGVGQEIRLDCRLVSDQIIGLNQTVNATNLRFKRLDRTDPFLDESSPFVQKVDERTIAFVKQNATLDDSGPYTCTAKVNGTNYPGCINTVEVGSPPKMVRDFTCTVMEFANMTCSWTNPDNGRVATNYTIEVVRGLTVFRQWMPCPINLTTPSSCTWTTSTDPYFEKYAFKFKFRINGTNSLGNESWEYVLDHDSIVKLPPIIGLTYHNLTRRTATLSWRPPVEVSHRMQASTSDPPPGKIIYQVELRRLAADPEVIETPDVDQLSYDNLLPNMEYNVTVRCHMDKVQRFDLYSDPVTVTFKTPKDRPDGPPPINQSGFLYKLFDNQRTITLLFSEIPRDNWNDDYFNYIIQVCPEQASSYECRNQTATRSLPDIENLSVSTRYDIAIWSNNSLGVSDRASTIRIFSHSEILPDPSDISVVLNTDSATISWTIPPTVNDEELERSLYWCESYVEDQCNGTVKSQVLQGPVNSATVNVSRPRDFIYGVAITDRRSGRSSGSVWSTCVAQAGAFVGQVRELKAEQDTDTTMRLSWNRICNSQRHYIGGYQADVCRINQDDAKRLVLFSDVCQRHEKTNLASSGNDSSSAQCRTQNFTLDSGDEYLLEGLEKGQAYRIVVRVLDKMSGRYTPDSHAVCAVAEGGWGVHMIVGIVVGGAIGLMVLVFSLYVLAKWMQKKLDAAKELKVTLPAPLQKGGGAGYSDFITRLNGCNKNGHDAYIDHNNVDGSILTEFPRRGSHSSLDRLIIERVPAVTVESSTRLMNGDSRGSANLNRESNSFEEPSTEMRSSPSYNALPGPQPSEGDITQNNATSPMPPYTQLGLSASHLQAGATNTANGHAPQAHTGNTGYSQLSVISDAPTPCVVIPSLNAPQNDDEDQDEEEASGGSLEEDNTTDRSLLQSPRRSPPPAAGPARTGGYVSLERAMAAPVPQATPAPAAVSNGYVPVHRANQ